MPNDYKTGHSMLVRLASRRRAVTIMVFYVGLLVLDDISRFLPIRDTWNLVKYWLIGLTNITLLFSTASCTLLRVRSLGKKTAGQLPVISEPQFVVPISVPQVDSRGKIVSVLRKNRWKIRDTSTLSASPVIHGLKGIPGSWGSLLFHFSLILIILGGCLSYFTGLYAGMVVTEGQQTEFKVSNLVDVERIPRWWTIDPGIRIELTKFTPLVSKEKYLTQYQALVTFQETGSPDQTRLLYINKPVSIGGYVFSIFRYGFAPRFVVTDNASGRVILDSYVNLVVPVPSSVDSLSLTDSPDDNINFQLFPDAVFRGRSISSRGPLPKNPVFLVWSDSQAKQPLPLGATRRLRDVTIQFKDLRYWANFRVNRDWGKPVIYGSFILAIAGLTLRFAYPRRQVLISLEQDGTVGISGSCDILPTLYQEELKALAQQMERMLNN